jgi:hypothetical protein
MIFDSMGFPRPTGATDFADSPHTCGVMWLVDHPQKPDPTQYVIGRKYIRHPTEKRYDMSRDNGLLLMYSLYKAGRADLVDLSSIDGKDLMSPAVTGFERIIKGKKPYPWQVWWFNRELETNWELQKLEEPFQIIVMADVYGVDYLRRWTQANNLWKWAIRRYYSELDGRWRGEPELAEMAIETIERKVKP